MDTDFTHLCFEDISFDTYEVTKVQQTFEYYIV